MSHHLSIELALPASSVGGGVSVSPHPNSPPVPVAVGHHNQPIQVQPQPVAELPPGAQFHFRPGNIVQGNVVLHVAPGKPLSINSKGIEFYFRGWEHVSITTYHSNGKGHRHTHTSTAGGDLFRMFQPFVVGSETKYEPGSIVKFPFMFQLPNASPHTLSAAFDEEGLMPEEQESGCVSRRYRRHRATAGIGYELVALAHVSGLFTSNLHGQVDLIVDPIFPIAPLPHGLQPATGKGHVTIPDYCCCDLFGSKPVSITATIPKVALTNGEIFPVTIEVKNDSDNAVDTVTLAIQQEITIRVSNGSWAPLPSVTRYITLCRSVVSVQVMPHTTKTLNQQLTITNLAPILNSNCITSTNVLLVRTHIHGFGQHINTRIPLHSPYFAGFLMPGQPQPHSPAQLQQQSPHQQQQISPAFPISPQHHPHPQFQPSSQVRSPQAQYLPPVVHQPPNAQYQPAPPAQSMEAPLLVSPPPYQSPNGAYQPPAIPSPQQQGSNYSTFQA